MKVFALVGKSGSGKSYQAINLCREMGIESILDDGLFISGNSILAGISAKRQQTKVRAIKTALFNEDAHRDMVLRKIGEVAPGSILVIGTSEKMIDKIVGRLGLPRPDAFIRIEDITTHEERKIADRQRNEMGRHIIPAPAFQLKKDFSGYFIHPLRTFWDRRGGKSRVSDRTVIRPPFSYPGKYVISHRAISDIALIAGSDVAGVDAVLRASADSVDASGAVVNMSVRLTYGAHILDVAGELQKRVAGRVEDMTAFNIKAVNVDVKGLR
jgi:uncharacterized alkaline shock family protein YloU